MDERWRIVCLHLGWDLGLGFLFLGWEVCMRGGGGRGFGTCACGCGEGDRMDIQIDEDARSFLYAFVWLSAVVRG